MNNKITPAQTALTNEDDIRKEVSAFLVGNDLVRKLTKAQVSLCLRTAITLGLSPLKREIHFIPYWNREAGRYDVSIVVGYEVYLKRAEESGKLEGWEIQTDGDPSKPETLVTTLTIYRKDWKVPFKYRVRYVEAVQTKASGEPTALWKKNPVMMLEKAAIGRGFRLCFPSELGGMPYVMEEVNIENNNSLNLQPPERGGKDEEINQEEKTQKKEEENETVKARKVETMSVLEQKLAQKRAEIEAKKKKADKDVGVQEKIKILTNEEAK